MGRFPNVATGLQWNINRWYDAEVGRWVSEEPIGFRENDTNLYCYIQNNTMGYVDYLGRFAETAAAISVGTVSWKAFCTAALNITTVLGVLAYFVPSSGGTTIYENSSGGTAKIKFRTDDVTLHLTSIFKKKYNGSECATMVKVTSDIDVYDADFLKSDHMGNFSKTLEYSRDEHQNNNRCGQDPDYAHGESVGITCRFTYFWPVLSQCFTLDGKGKEQCDPSSGIDLAYEYTIKMYVYSGSKLLETLNLPGSSGLKHIGKYVCRQ